jgi:hypothetical protein
MAVIYQVDGLRPTEGQRANPAYAFPWVETSGLEATFLELAAQWERETGMLSLVQKMVMHPAYQRIIGMGQPVVPLILRALEAITGANPVLPEQRGRLDEMAAAWLAWGRENGYGW